jgi:outer membrane receptor protein involved in Fe transport
MRSPFKTQLLFFTQPLLLVLLAVVVVLFSNSATLGQATTGTIKGVVTDQNGAVIAGANVIVKNQSTGLESTYTTSDRGNVVIPSLIPGKYTVTVESPGFSRSAVTDIDVRVGIDTPLTIALTPGNVSETVTVVSGTEEIAQRDQAQISASFESRKIADLPSNSAGGGIDTLALLIPGVVQNSGGGTNTNGTGFSVNGNRSRSNNFQIDGSDNNDLSVAGPNLFVDNQDQVQEFQVITNNFSAQYGRNLGAVVNIVTKSGSNDFHGTAFEFFRDQRNLDSLNNTERASGLDNPPRQLSNVFGGTLGGPLPVLLFGEGDPPAAKLLRNRAFFFFSYEGIRQPAQAFAQSGGFGIVPGDLPKLSAAFPNNPVIDAIVRLNPSVLPLGTLTARSDLDNCNATTLRLGGAPASQFRRCNRDFIDVGSGVPGVNPVRVEGFLLERLFPFDFNQNEWSLRGDAKVTNKDNFYVRFLKQTGVQLNSLGSTNGFSGDLIFTTQNFGGTYTRQISNSMVNEFRAVRTKLFVDFGGGCDAGTLGCIPSPSQIEDAQIESLNPSGIRGVTLTGNALRSMGMGGGLPQGRSTVLYDFGDNLTLTRGRHTIITGAELKYTTATVPFLPNFGGAYTFNTQARVINNAPSAVSVALGDPTVPYTEIDQFYFFQDDFKIRPNLTLNLGVRYEYTGQPIDDLTVETTARESSSTPFWNPALPIGARIVPRVPPDKNNWAPRFGFAWTPRFGSGFLKTLVGEDATVIRGGYAIAYDPAFYNILLNVANSAPFSISLAAAPSQLPATNPLLPLPGIFGSQIRAAVQASGVLPVGQLDPKWLGQTVVAPNFHAPYSQQWSFGIQRQFGSRNVAEVRYVGNHGVGLFQNIQRNPFVGVPGDPTLEFGTAGAASGLYGFTLDLSDAGIGAFQFPSFASQVIPSGLTGQICTNLPGTADNESSCNGRVLRRGAITSRENTGQSRYDSLQARYNGRFLRNALNFGATYTFSKTIDNASEIFTFGTENSSFAQNAFDPGAGERSLSALHRPHVFSLNFIYDMPFFKEQHGFVGHLLGGWQINGTHVYNSGRRYTAAQNLNASFLSLGPSYLSGGEGLRPFAGNPAADQRRVAINQVDAFLFGLLGTITDPNGLLLLNDLNNGTVTPTTANDVRFIYNGPGAAKLFGTPFGNVPRYSLTGPPINQTNIGIFKNTKAFESLTIQFRAELFNAFNHPQPGYGVTRASSLPASILADNAGLASAPFADDADITLARRVIQFGLRFIF